MGLLFTLPQLALLTTALIVLALALLVGDVLIDLALPWVVQDQHRVLSMASTASSALSLLGSALAAVWLAGRLGPKGADAVGAGDRREVEDVVDRPERWH